MTSRAELLTDPETSRRLAHVRQHNTSPEMLVRKILYALGFRFRVKGRGLPGSPDIVNRSQRWAVFVHGCFWHGHEGCRRATVPKRNRAFWLAKFHANRDRDRVAAAALRRLGYRVVIVWECQVEKYPGRIAAKLARHLC